MDKHKWYGGNVGITSRACGGMVDALDLGSSVFDVEVRILSGAQGFPLSPDIVGDVIAPR